ncbi:MAG: hypothetical protein J0H94_08220 [Rhizobiales bacterium]|nr:hypothetical protein [Hyphomicrobiales bacterium]
MPASAEMRGGMQASDMVMKGMTSDLPMSGMCDKCIKKDQAKHACFAVCVGLQAVLPIGSVLRVAATAPHDPLAERLFNGSGAPPDLPPPKLIVSV